MAINQSKSDLRKFLAPELIIGKDARLKAGIYCTHFGAQKALIVTDQTLYKSKWFSDVTECISQETIEYEVFCHVSPNPRDNEIMEGVQVYFQNHCDIILALGGGSVLDCAKGIGIIATNGGHILKYEGVDKIDVPMPPLICIPTTGGSAADVSQFAIINNTCEKYKISIISKAVVPDVALIDPIPLSSMSPFLTACTGMDVLSHAIEAYVSNASSAITDLHALEAIRLIKENLPEAIKAPQNLTFRENISLACLYAGLAFSNASLGSVHAMAHSLGGYLDLPHGECNAILLPHVVDYNFSFSQNRYSEIANIFGIQTNGLSSSLIKTKLLDLLIQFKQDLGLKDRLKDKGVNISDINHLTSKAIKDPCNATNPRPPKKEDLELIYNESL